jgi:DNA-binding protein YbaB
VTHEERARAIVDDWKISPDGFEVLVEQIVEAMAEAARDAVWYEATHAERARAIVTAFAQNEYHMDADAQSVLCDLITHGMAEAVRGAGTIRKAKEAK